MTKLSYKKSNQWDKFMYSDMTYGLPDALRTKAMRQCPSWKAHASWESVLRQDICAYCRGPGGTVDHITPLLSHRNKAKQRKLYRESWYNKTGACPACNSDKKSSSLLFFLLHEQDFIFEVWRQDDNGNEFNMGWRQEYEEAQKMIAELSAKHHKQTFWIVFKRPSRDMSVVCT